MKVPSNVAGVYGQCLQCLWNMSVQMEVSQSTLPAFPSVPDPYLNFPFLKTASVKEQALKTYKNVALGASIRYFKMRSLEMQKLFCRKSMLCGLK